MKEVWKDIVGYEGLYQVSNLGRIKAIRNDADKILTAQKKQSGYIGCSLSKNGVVKHYKVHRLVAEAFIPNIENKPQINHINGIKTDNNVYNLEWCTARENINHSFRAGLSKGRRDGENKLSKKVRQYSLNGAFIKEWESAMQIQRELGFNNSAISACCLNKQKQSYGYIWRHYDQDIRKDQGNNP